MRYRVTGKVLLPAAVLLTIFVSAARAENDFTEDLFSDTCRFDHRGANDFWFTLHPGDQWFYEGEDDGALVELLVTILPDIEHVTFEDDSGETRTVRTRVVEEREWEDGELVEVSRNFVSTCAERSDVFYFGEDVDDYEDGEIVGHEGAWRAGVDGARPGILMPGTFLLGAAYFQEIAPGVALDRGVNVAMGLEVAVPAGSFGRCVEVEEDSALEEDAESIKIYCPGVGMIVDDELELVWYDRHDD